MRFLCFFSLVGICFLFDACISTYGNNIARHYTPLIADSTVAFATSKTVWLFFDGEPIQFEYYKVGLVEVRGNQTATTADLLNHLKYEAFKHGANAIIAVRDGYGDRQSGVLFSKTPPTNYTSHIYSGLAVKIKEEAKVNALIDKNDTLFIAKASADDAAYARRSGNELAGSFVLGLILTGIIIYFVATK